MPTYTLDSYDRRLLEGWFREPFPASMLQDPDWVREFRFVTKLPDGQLVFRTRSRAMIRVGVLEGWAAAWAPEEGEGAKALDRLFSYRFMVNERDRLLDTIRPGLPLEQALANARAPEMPAETRRTSKPLPGGGREVVVHFNDAGLLVIEVDKGDVIQSFEILSGPKAFDRIVADAEPAGPQPAGPPPLPARTRPEVELFLRIKEMQVIGVDERREAGRLRLDYRVSRDGALQSVSFTVDESEGSDPTHLGGGSHSRILDPAHLILFASSVEEGLPEDPGTLDLEGLKHQARELALAAEAVDEVTKFIPAGHDSVRIEAMKTHAARRLYERDPDRFSRARLTATAARIRKELGQIDKLIARRSA